LQLGRVFILERCSTS